MAARAPRAETALITVVADCYLAGVSTRRMDKLVKTLGIHCRSRRSRGWPRTSTSTSTSSAPAPGDAGPFTFVAADALTMKVREGGRVINAVVLVATGVNADGRREVLGLRSRPVRRGRLELVLRRPRRPRPGGVRLVTSDAHAGLVEAIAANLPGAVWQRCRTHYAANLM
jgi:transposase-like protein